MPYSQSIEHRLSGTSQTFSSVSDNELHVSWQALHYMSCCAFSCETRGDGCVKWWRHANRVACLHFLKSCGYDLGISTVHAGVQVVRYGTGTAPLQYKCTIRSSGASQGYSVPTVPISRMDIALHSSLFPGHKYGGYAVPVRRT